MQSKSDKLAYSVAAIDEYKTILNKLSHVGLIQLCVESFHIQVDGTVPRAMLINTILEVHYGKEAMETYNEQ